jgi:hypothetical protein
MSDRTLAWRALNRATLARQMLLKRDAARPLLAVERLVALQAQWPRPPFVGLWSRVKGFARRDLQTLIERRQVVRATLLRGTLHVLTARDYLALRPAVQTALESGMRSILRQKGVAIDVPSLAREARGLLAASPLTFEDLRDRLKRAHPKANERAMGYVARMALPLVMVPEGGSAWAFPARSRFALADDWLGRAVPLEAAPPDALLLRYLAAYGPASVRDMQAWSGLPALAEAVERLRPRLSTFRDETGREIFDLPEAPRPDASAVAPVRFLPEYDNVIATRADERFVAKAHRPRVFLSALRIAATLLVDGFVAGTWKVEAAKGVVTVTVAPFGSFAARTKKEIEAEAEALAAFQEPEGGKVEVRFSR